MNDIKKASEGGVSEANKRGLTLSLRQAEYITFLLVITTLISAWHISDLWSGIVTGLLGCITIAFSFMVGGARCPAER